MKVQAKLKNPEASPRKPSSWKVCWLHFPKVQLTNPDRQGLMSPYHNELNQKNKLKEAAPRAQPTIEKSQHLTSDLPDHFHLQKNSTAHAAFPKTLQRCLLSLFQLAFQNSSLQRQPGSSLWLRLPTLAHSCDQA